MSTGEDMLGCDQKARAHRLAGILVIKQDTDKGGFQRWGGHEIKSCTRGLESVFFKGVSQEYFYQYNGSSMETVTISPDYSIVMPQGVRKVMQLVPGQKVQIILYGNRIELLPQKSIKNMRGFLKGINTEFQRNKERY